MNLFHRTRKMIKDEIKLYNGTVIGVETLRNIF